MNPLTFTRKISALGYIVATAIVLHVFISIALILNGTLTVIETALSRSASSKDVPAWASKLIRSSAMFFAVLFVWFLPFLGELVNFVSAFGCVITGVVFPLLAYGKLFSPTFARKVWHYSLFLFSAVSVLYGAGTSLEALVKNAGTEWRAKYGGTGNGLILFSKSFPKVFDPNWFVCHVLHSVGV